MHDIDGTFALLMYCIGGICGVGAVLLLNWLLPTIVLPLFPVMCP